MKLADELMKRTKALPAAAASNFTDVLNLGSPNPCAGVHVPIEVTLEIPALPALVDAKNATFEVFDCDTEGGTYAVVEGTGNTKRLGAGGAGAAAKWFRFFLPPNIRQFVKYKCTVDSGGGDNTGVTYTVNHRC